MSHWYEHFFQRRRSSRLPVVILVMIGVLATRCQRTERLALDANSYFEGEITLTESRGLYGALFKINTTYTLSENYLKREQRLGGVTSLLGTYAGIIVDLDRDSVCFYHVNKMAGYQKKHTTSIASYRSDPKYQSWPESPPSPVDQTFRLLPDYHFIRHVKDSTEIEDFQVDYSLYRDGSGLLKQEVFDTKEIKVKRQLVEMVFMDIPEEVNFILKSDLLTTLSDIPKDTIVSGETARATDGVLREALEDSLQDAQENDLDKLASNKWVHRMIDLLKKGVDLNIQIRTRLSKVTARTTTSREFTFPGGDFDEVSDFNEFLRSLPSEGGFDFDD